MRKMLRGESIVSCAPEERPSLPDGLIAVDSTEGRRLLEESGSVDYEPLARFFESQSQLRYCSVASSVVALNALYGRETHTQSTFFAPEVAAVCAPEDVAQAGMTLEELASVLRLHGAAVTVHYASERTVAQFRAYAIENLEREGDFIIVNYLREIIGQCGGGHFSPLAACHEELNRTLVLDVNTHRYPPVWVDVELLFAAMCAIDPASGKSRGYLTVSLPGASASAVAPAAQAATASGG
jgi:hypothetical protein